MRALAALRPAIAAVAIGTGLLRPGLNPGSVSALRRRVLLYPSRLPLAGDGGPIVVSAGPGSAEARGEATTCRGRAWVIRAGVLALAVSLGLYAVNVALHPHVLLSDVDLAVYRDAGLVARRSPGQLYLWQQPPGLRFTYTPFAAALCIDVSVLPWGLVAGLMLAGSVAGLLATVWLALGGLGWHGASRLGAACAVSAVALWLEPVQRTLHTGEIDLLLMLLVVRDLSNRGRRWQGAGVGAAAGIKLVALIFIPYLLLTGRYREAATAAGTFAATVVTGAVLLPQASATWWLGGTFLNANRTGFVGFLPNQSLLGMTTRLAGAVPPAAVWLALAVLAGGPGLLLAAFVHRQGWPVQGWVVCAVTGLIASPVSWDHHWVWLAPALVVPADMAVRSHGAVRAAWSASAGLVAVAFGAWPSLWRGGGSAVPWGLIWYAPYTPNDTGGIHPEYHWAGLQLLAGNLYLLAGFVILATAAIAAARHAHATRARALVATPART
jgi:alpha-1,2-mannosyltransferase